MAAGEYVSVSSQLDTEHADLARERAELATDVESERAELAAIYVRRGLDTGLAKQVAEQLMEKDVPFLKRILPHKFTAAYMKGRSHYACQYRIARSDDQPV